MNGGAREILKRQTDAKIRVRDKNKTHKKTENIKQNNTNNNAMNKKNNKCGWLKNSELVCQPSRWADEEMEDNLLGAKVFMEKIKLDYLKLRRLMISSSRWKIIKCDVSCLFKGSCDGGKHNSGGGDGCGNHSDEKEDDKKGNNDNYLGTKNNKAYSKVEKHEDVRLTSNASDKSTLCSKKSENSRVSSNNCSFVYYNYDGMNRRGIFKSQMLHYIFSTLLNYLLITGICIKILFVCASITLLFMRVRESLTKSRIYDLNQSSVGGIDGGIDGVDNVDDTAESITEQTASRCESLCNKKSQAKKAIGMINSSSYVYSDSKFNSMVHRSDSGASDSWNGDQWCHLSGVILPATLCFITESILSMVLYILKCHSSVKDLDFEDFSNKTLFNNSFRNSRQDLGEESAFGGRINPSYFDFTLSYLVIFSIVVLFYFSHKLLLNLKS